MKWRNFMSENYYLISDNDVHMPIRCTMIPPTP